MTTVYRVPDPSDVKRVAVVGAGMVGASWAALFLAIGLDVAVHDPHADAGQASREFILGAWNGLVELGVAPDQAPRPWLFTTDLAEAVAEADFIQENGAGKGPTSSAASILGSSRRRTPAPSSHRALRG